MERGAEHVSNRFRGNVLVTPYDARVGPPCGSKRRSREQEERVAEEEEQRAPGELHLRQLQRRRRLLAK